MTRKPVLKSSISTGTYQEFITEIFRLVNQKTPSYVCFANVHMVVEGYTDTAFQKIVNSAALVAPDGKPIALFISLSSGMRQERVCGMDILPDILLQAEAIGKSVYFYGSTPELLMTLLAKVQLEFPALKISGFSSPPFRTLTEQEHTLAIRKIKSAAPDLVFVALGCPKQEKWMAANKDEIGACLLGVGQALSVYAGVEKRLPVWMRNLSIEWLYRLYLEPQRLWKRYLVTNSYFLLLAGKYLINRLIRWRSTAHELQKSILEKQER